MLELTRHKIAAPVDRTLRLLHLSDLHGAWFGREQEEIGAIAQAEKPDVIVATGDLIDSSCDEKPAEALLKALTAAAPTYCVTGNHEAGEKIFGSRSYGQLLRNMEACGARLLRGETAELGGGVTLTGVDDMLFLLGRDYSEYIQSVGERAGGSYRILLAHRPEMIRYYAQAGFHLTLCGHAHGGQIRLPMTDGLYAPGQGLLPRYTSGLYEHKSGMKMIVSRGLGNSVPVPRLFNSPEVSLIEILPG